MKWAHLQGLLVVLAFRAAIVEAQDVVAIVSSQIEPYLQACDAFEQSIGDITALRLMARDGVAALPEGEAIVVAFGSKAATLPLPRSLTVVEVMAPSARAFRQSPSLRHRIHMLPPPDSLLAFLRHLQPALRRLAVPFVLSAGDGYRDDLARRAARRGVEVLPYGMADPNGVPGALRQMLLADVDAIWLPPDPLLIRASSFAVLRQFSLGNGVPLYAPTTGFVEAGAVAAIHPTYTQIGQAAAQVVRRLLAGEPTARDTYPTGLRRSLNARAAAAVGLSPPQNLSLDVVVDGEH